MCFQAPYVVQEHPKERNPKDELLSVDPGNSSIQESMNSRRSDYNMHTNLPFVNQLTLL